MDRYSQHARSRIAGIDDEKFTEDIKTALKLINEIEDSDKQEGLERIQDLLTSKDARLESHGYSHVIFKELIRFIQFESGGVLRHAIDIVLFHYTSTKDRLDEIAETLIYRVGRSTDVEVSKICLAGVVRLMEVFDDQIALHSRQLLKLSDLNEMTDLIPFFIIIMEKLDEMLPNRRRVEVS